MASKPCDDLKETELVLTLIPGCPFFAHDTAIFSYRLSY